MSGIDWATMHKDAHTVLEGDFGIVVSEAKPGESSNKKPMIKCVLVIESGPYTGRKIYHNFTVSPESQIAMQMFFRALKVLGVGESFFAQNPTTEGIAQAIIGKRAMVTLEPREWQGQARENVKSWKDATGSGVPTMGVPQVGGDLSSMNAAPLSSLPSTPAPSFGEGPDPF